MFCPCVVEVACILLGSAMATAFISSMCAQTLACVHRKLLTALLGAIVPCCRHVR
jgi:hypothetical protein